MNYDSMIVEYILDDFIKRDIAILSVHDSFVVPFGQEDRLNSLMKEAFILVTKQEKVRIKYNSNITKKGLYASQHQDRDFYLDKLSFIQKGNPSKGYEYRMKRHYRWLHNEND